MRSFTITAQAAVFFALFVAFVFSVKTQDFKTCSQAGFCRRGRALASRAHEAGSSWTSPYSLDSASLNIGESSFTASVVSSLYPDIKFALEVRVHEDGVTRVRLDEVDGLRKRYDETASWALVREPARGKVAWAQGKKEIKASFGPSNSLELKVAYAPLRISLSRSGKEEIVLNGEGLMHMEHYRIKEIPGDDSAGDEPAAPEDEANQKPLQVNPRAWFEGEGEDGWWSETFNTWTDSKPKGPESLSIDVNFPKHGHVFGIPQHATRLNLPTTTGPGAVYEDPYRLYNLDVFEYLADSPMSIYGAIPLIHAHSASSTVGFLNLIGSETWIDVAHPSAQSTNTHWISESGIMDVFLLPGPTPDDVFQQYARLTGTTALPPDWSLGYHQCRWNYLSSTDVREVAQRLDDEDMPFDVLWLDIDYAEDHKYFIWKDREFPDPVEMTNDIAALKRKMVVIIDPHLKRVQDYPVYKQASDLNLLVKPPNGEGEFEGWCWSGSSSWVDFFNPNSWPWWISLFKITSDSKEWHWTKSTEDIHLWNDMNEPSVFNGPEITMQKDNVHYGGWEHRDVHNINGMLFHNLSKQALAARSTPAKRPFVLSRAFFAGSQRLSAIWTGDNLGTWEHMAVGIPMLLSNGIAGMTFSGADVGGFFGNPEPEMLVRWYQLGIFMPFFRAHAHIDTKRREPYLLNEPYKSAVRSLLRLRYSMLPVWYTAFRESSVTGFPVLRPHYVVFPKDTKGFVIDDQFYVGSSGLVVKPVTKPGVEQTQIYLAENQVYYHYFTYDMYHGAASGRNVTIQASLTSGDVPMLIRGGSVISTRERPRRSSPLMRQDPFTLHIALDRHGKASGEVYLDDGETYAHREGDYVWRQFQALPANTKAKSLSISSIDLGADSEKQAVDGVTVNNYKPGNAFVKSISQVRVEKIVILGLGAKPASVKLEGNEPALQWSWDAGVSATSGRKDGASSVLTIKNPGVNVADDWVILVGDS